ncbi:MAG: hypothetical protein ACOYBP_08660 [Microbacteriaceae bacterium]
MNNTTYESAMQQHGFPALSSELLGSMMETAPGVWSTAAERTQISKDGLTATEDFFTVSLTYFDQPGVPQCTWEFSIGVVYARVALIETADVEFFEDWDARVSEIADLVQNGLTAAEDLQEKRPDLVEIVAEVFNKVDKSDWYEDEVVPTHLVMWMYDERPDEEMDEMWHDFRWVNSNRLDYNEMGTEWELCRESDFLGPMEMWEDFTGFDS